MNIHPLWYLCLITRLSLIYIIRYIYLNVKKYRKVLYFLLLIIGIGFIYKSVYGSNDEIQIGKVFWHNSRCIHGIFYLLSLYYLVNDELNISLLLLLIDIIFSILYRIIYNL